MTDESLKQKTITGVSWNMLSQISTQLIQFVLGIILARLLIPDDFGLIAMLMIFIALSNVFIDSGFSNALIQKKGRTKEDISTVFYFNLVISIVCYLILFFAAPYVALFYKAPILSSILRVFAISIIINSLYTVQGTILTISLDFKKKAIINFIAILISGLIGVVMAYMGYGVWALVGQTISSSLVSLILFIILVRWKPMLVFSKKSFGQLYSFGSKLLIANIVSTIMNNLYQIFIGRYFSADQVGYYSRGMHLPAIASNTLSSVLQNVTYPVLTSVQDEKERLLSIYRRTIRITGFFVIPAMTGLAFISEPFVLFFLTEKWIPAIVLMQWVCFARLFTPISTINLSILNAVGRSDLYLKVDLSKLPLTLIAFAITLPLGLKAVVIGHFITSFISFFINAYMPGKLFGYGAWRQIKDLLPMVLSTAIMSLCIWLVIRYIDNDLLKIIIAILLGGSIYYGVSYLLGIKEVEEVNSIILKVWRRIK